MRFKRLMMMMMMMMPSFKGKSNSYNMRSLLKKVFPADTPEVTLGNGGEKDKLYYSGVKALIMTPAADKDIPRTPITINALFKKLNGDTRFKEAFKEIDTLVFPICECQNILGFIPRMHWVSVHYDKKANKATLIDSRPAYISFLYPTKPMEKMFREGLSALLDNETPKEMTFNTVYQGVQHNDTYCGSWTAANIVCLANGIPVETQKKAFKSEEEIYISNYNHSVSSEKHSVTPREYMDELAKIKDQPTPTFFQKISNWVKSIFSKKSVDSAENGTKNSTHHTSSSSSVSYGQMMAGGIVPNHTPPPTAMKETESLNSDDSFSTQSIDSMDYKSINSMDYKSIDSMDYKSINNMDSNESDMSNGTNKPVPGSEHKPP